MKYLELITLNTVSLGWVVLNFVNKQIEIPITWKSLIYDPKSFMAFMVGLSIIFFNIARGVSYLKKRNADTTE